MSEYVEFLEEHLGMIEHGWSTDAEGEELPFDVVKYEGGPFPDTVTYSTLGLSHHYLNSPRSEKIIKQELFIVADANFGDGSIVGVLQQLGREALETHLAYLHGRVIGPRGKLFSDTDLEALYATSPVYFPDSFHVFKGGDGEIPIVQVWMVPITKTEANFVTRNGWSKFEDMLVETDPDLINFKRTSIIE